jgi:hypothetical protein
MFFFEKKNQKTFATLRPLKSSSVRMPSLRAQRSNPGSRRILTGAHPSLANPHNPSLPPPPAPTNKSLFASFSSEKEESFP